MKDYLVAAYKATPASPTFLEARDALLAVALANDPDDFTLFAQAFAALDAPVHDGGAQEFLEGARRVVPLVPGEVRPRSPEQRMEVPSAGLPQLGGGLGLPDRVGVAAQGRVGLREHAADIDELDAIGDQRAEIATAEVAGQRASVIGELRVRVADRVQDRGGVVGGAERLHDRQRLFAAREGRAQLKARALELDAVILDLDLPVMDGHEAARRIREHPGRENTRFIAVTGFGTEDDRARSLAAGFVEHLVKPVDLDHLFRALQAAPVAARPALSP